MRPASRRPMLAAALALLALPSWPAAPDRPRPMVLEDVVSFKTIGDLQVSPDGGTAVIAVRAARLEENRFETDLFMVDLTGGTPMRPITFSKGPDTHPRWSPDGRRIAFLSGRNGTTQVWALPRDGGEALPLTAHAQP